MIYGYARVSTDAQDLTSQLAQLKAAGCDKVFREKITGTTADRPQLQKLMKVLAPGDVVITPTTSRRPVSISRRMASRSRSTATSTASFGSIAPGQSRVTA
jgi:DNA invertase Pin-like site-specific DNA recombinase